MSEDVLTSLRKAALATGAAMRRRDELVVEAAKVHSYSTVAQAAKMSKSRVQQIVAAQKVTDRIES